jgi:glutathione S-transferase
LAEHESVIKGTLERVQADLAQNRTFWIEGSDPTQAGWDLGVALAYLDLRMPALSWKAKHPDCVKVLEICEKHPLFQSTRPPAA